MTDKLRRANAKAAASRYAPPPDGSYVTYGFIAAASVAVGVMLVGGFFGVDMLSHPTGLFWAALAAFGAGVVGRTWQKRRFALAFQRELSQRGGRTEDEAS